MKGTDIFRLTCIIVLWVALCFVVVTSQQFTLRVAFILVASAIIVFVPLYKKYVRGKRQDSHGDGRRKP